MSKLYENIEFYNWDEIIQMKLTNKQKLEKAIKTLKIYANSDFWYYNPLAETEGKRFTSLEVLDKDGNLKDGWDYAEETLKEIE